VRRIAAVLALALAGASHLAAAYTFYQTDPLTSVNTANWWQAGSVTPTSFGLTAPDANGGSLISKVGSPTGNDYEVRANIRLVASGGTYTLFARATADAQTGGAGAGTYLAYEMRNPTFDANGYCSANFLVLKRVGGLVSVLHSFTSACRNGMTMRLAVRGDFLLTYNDQLWTHVMSGLGIASGQPGVGGYATPSGNAIGLQAGPADTVAPGVVPSASLGVAAFSNRIEMQWQGAPDDANGIGFSTYYVYRNGSFLGLTHQSIFADETVAPGSTYTYQIWVVDQHYNWAGPTSANLTAAPAGATEPRRIGVRPDGAYWGAAGEQIDLRSGNLNYTVPLLKALARSGWSATLSLSYNSQMWRNDAGGTWKLGRDVGYGLGWRLMAGSITPVYYYCVRKQQFGVELFRGQKDCARPTGTALCGIYRGPGGSRRACRSAHSAEELLHRPVVARGTEERRAHGRAAGSRQRATDASVAASSGCRRPLE
jgi:chitodextrinase